MDIKQSKAIISGGASGLGFATAKNIINKGGKVALLDINKDGEKSAKSLGNSVVDAAPNYYQKWKDRRGNSGMAIAFGQFIQQGCLEQFVE